MTNICPTWIEKNAEQHVFRVNTEKSLTEEMTGRNQRIRAGQWVRERRLCYAGKGLEYAYLSQMQK